MLKTADILGAAILVVDDQPANVQLLARLLADAGYTDVETCMAPREVERLHRQKAFDLILLDIQMPLMDGFEVMEELKRSAPGDYLPVIVLTAQPAHKLRALQAGAKDFIGKPFDVLEVRTRIHNMLEVRLLYRELACYNDTLEKAVAERTAELRASEERFRNFTRLASDWYWEQDETGQLLTQSGPVLELMGFGRGGFPAEQAWGWHDGQRETLRQIIADRKPFLDFLFTTGEVDGTRQQFRVSGEPVFNSHGHFVGYRGIGVEYGKVSHFCAACRPA